MIKKLIATILVSIALIIGAFYFVFSPSYVSSIQFQGHHIRINRDKHGIPHIHAPNRRSFLYAWGYAVSEDRLFQSTFYSQIYAEGRMSEFVGERALPNDIMMRDLSFPEVANHIAERMKKENQTYYSDMAAYVQGVNDGAYSRFALPIEFHILGINWQNWTVATPYLIHKVLEWSISHNLFDQYARSALLTNHSLDQIDNIIPNTQQNWAFDSVATIKDEDLPERFKSINYGANASFQPIQVQKIVSLGIPEFLISPDGSNVWAVSGKHTASGKAILSGDPHLDSILPSSLYQIKATYTQDGKKVTFAGAGLPGVPVACGKTQYLALSLAVLHTDTQDLFKQKIQGNKYLVDGIWRDLKVRNETILIKTEKGLIQHNHTVRLTHRGPILHYIISPYGTYQLNQPFSLSWTGYNEDYVSVLTTSQLIEATDIDTLRTKYLDEGTSYFLSVSMVLATADNHIIYHQGGLNPLRSNHRAGSYIKDGTSSKHDWLGFMPPQDRLQVIDPKSGFVVNGNNKGASNLFQGSYFNYSIYTARADRLEKLIKDEIASGRKITNQFAQALLYDTVDIYCQQILPQILSILPQANQTHNNFNCDFKSSSYQATMYEVFILELWLLMRPLSNLNISFLPLHRTSQSPYNYIHSAYNGDKNKQTIIGQAWKHMQKRLSKHFNTDDQTTWLWGNFHREVAKHVLFGTHDFLGKLYNRQGAGWGNVNTPNVGRANKLELGNFDNSHRAALRSIYDFGGESLWVIDGGVSQNLLSPHYDDQWKLFMAQKMLQVGLPSQQSQEL